MTQDAQTCVQIVQVVLVAIIFGFILGYSVLSRK
jgi:hypothetical protein